jgi:hypothetical protein
MTGLNALLDELGDAVGEAVRPAAQAGAQVLYDQVKANVAGIGKVTGNLAASIYQVYSQANSQDQKRATYHVSWNASTAPHGHLVEYGHIMRYVTKIATKGPRKGQWVTVRKVPLAVPKQVGARPFVRPAMSKFPAAIEAATRVLVEKIEAKL